MNARRIGVLIVVVFLLFFVISQPQASADLVLSILYILRDAGNAIIAFVSALF